MYNKASLKFEDIKNKIKFEIFGIEYNVSVTRKYLDELEKMLENEVDDKALMVKALDEILGKGEYDKLKKIYEDERKEEFDDVVWYNVIIFIARQIKNYFDDIERRERYQNREDRRKNWRNNNNYRRY